MTSKQRASLRKQANGIETILHLGKGEINENIIKQTQDALKARELIKGRVLESNTMSPREVAQELASLTRSEVIQVIGTRFVLFKRNPQNIKIEF